MDRSKQIYQLVEQWCHARDPLHTNESLRQIAILTGCITQVPKQLSEQENQHIIQWLQENYPHAYLWAMSQNWIGHPAMLWGTLASTKGAASKSS